MGEIFTIKAVIIIMFFLIISCAIYLICIVKLSGKNATDEMIKFFKEKTFKDIGIALTIISGIFLILNIIRYGITNDVDNLSVLKNYIFSDIKYFIVAILLYLYNTIKLKIVIRDLDKDE